MGSLVLKLPNVKNLVPELFFCFNFPFFFRRFDIESRWKLQKKAKLAGGSFVVELSPSTAGSFSRPLMESQINCNIDLSIPVGNSAES